MKIENLGPSFKYKEAFPFLSKMGNKQERMTVLLHVVKWDCFTFKISTSKVLNK
jgi:hypothetical protein